MSRNDDRLSDLLLRWEESWDDGTDLSAEELCIDCPELINALRKRIAALREMKWLDRRSSEMNVETKGGDPHETSTPPKVLANRYRLEELISVGGFGQVWKGFDPELQRYVAIKIPKVANSKSSDDFIKEARRVAKLKHPGIVTVYDVGRDNELPFIVSDLIDGGNLREFASRTELANSDAARLVMQISMHLSFAHEQGIIHRDIKPANILLDKYGKAYITDFGISLSIQEAAEREGDSTGTLMYMSPEQMEGKPLDGRSDVYSLGVVFHELLTGQLPYHAKTFKDLRGEIRNKSPLPLRTATMKLPNPLNAIIVKCLEKDPDRRYQTAQELAADIKRFLQSPASSPESTAQFQDKRKQVERLIQDWRFSSAIKLLEELSGRSKEFSPVDTQWIRQTIESCRKDFAKSAEKLAAAERFATSFLERRDYDQVIHLVQPIPPHARTQKLETLLNQAIETSEEVLYLQNQLDDALVKSDVTNLSLTLERLLTIQPDNRKALAAEKKLSAYRRRNGIVDRSQRRSPAPQQISVPIWFIGTALLVIAVVAPFTWGTLVLYLGMAEGTIKINIDADDVSVNIDDRSYDLTKLLEPIRLNVGDHRIVVLREQNVVAEKAFPVLQGVNEDLMVQVPKPVEKGVTAPETKDNKVQPIPYALPATVAAPPAPNPLIRRIDPNQGKVLSVIFGIDNENIATSGESHNVKIWNIKDGRTTYDVKVHSSGVPSLAITPDGKTIATGSWDKTIRIWDVKSGRMLNTLHGHTDEPSRLVFTADGKRLVSVGKKLKPTEDEGVRLWDIKGGEINRWQIEKNATSLPHGLALHPDGKRAFVCTGTDSVYEVNLEKNFVRPSFRTHRSLAWCVAVTPDGTHAISGAAPNTAPMYDGDTSLRIWNISSEIQVRRCDAYQSRPFCIAMSPDGSKFATGDCWHIWGNEKPVPSIGCSVRIWDFKTGKQLARFKGHQDTITSVAFSPNGQIVASSSYDGTVRIWAVPSVKANEAPTLVLSSQTEVWAESPTNFAKYESSKFELGLGERSDGYGISHAGIEIQNPPVLDCEISDTKNHQKLNHDSFAGVIVDYATDKGYSKRVALNYGVYAHFRKSPSPHWGTKSVPNQYVDLGPETRFELNLAKWAPDDWNGRVWFTPSLQNTGKGTTMNFRIRNFLTNSSSHRSQKPTNLPPVIAKPNTPLPIVPQPDDLSREIIGKHQFVMINLSNNARHPEQIIEFKADRSVEFVNQVKNGFPVGKVGSWTFKDNILRVHLDSGGDIELREERKGFRRGTSTNFDKVSRYGVTLNKLP
jgi:serine/threonine protein kinase